MIVVQLVLRVYTQTTPFFEKQTIFYGRIKYTYELPVQCIYYLCIKLDKWYIH